MSKSGATGGEILLLEKGTLWEKLLSVTARAIEIGALQPIPTESETIEEGGISFIVRILSNLVRKQEERWRREREARGGESEENPFLPYDEDLFVAPLTDTHLCLLNKFNVVEHHLLIVTRDFEDQDEYLTRRDFAAMLAAMAEYEGLGFYNGGTVAGASQRHKHLQLVPLPLMPSGDTLPVDGALRAARYEGPTGRTEVFPFRHAVIRVDPNWFRTPMESAGAALDAFHALLRATGMERGDPRARVRQSGPYNLLITRQWMLLVPRSEEFFAGISINALGFAGGLLVRDERQMRVLLEKGPLAALRSVAFPG